MNYIGISKPLIRTRVCLILGIQETLPNCPQNTKIDFLDILKETSNGTYQDHPLAIVFERRKLSISVMTSAFYSKTSNARIYKNLTACVSCESHVS